MDDHDFGGYATKAGLKCSDGRTITPDAFKHMDGQTIPLVWQHMHDAPENVLGHAMLQNRDDGVYAYCFFNSTDAAKNANLLVQHKDVTSLSIYANALIEKSKKVLHGDICEVSLALKGANPGAKIDYVRVAHGQGDIETLDDEAIITTGIELEFELQHADTKAQTYQDVYNTLSADQRALFEVMLAQALGETKHSDEGDSSNADGEDKIDEKPSEDPKNDESVDNKDLKHKEQIVARNVFERRNKDDKDGPGDAVHNGNALTHSDVETIFENAKRLGSLKEALGVAVQDGVLAHADGDYGITNIDMLFPDAQAVDSRPEWITRKMEWVESFLGATRKLPFSRIKSMSADLTHEEARAKGYIKGTLKKEQFFAIAKRETTPKTIYKKQRLDRDDIIDIIDFDVVAWLWIEMYFMLREEIARAILVSDGREVDDEDKIDENNIRPIAFDDEFYTDVVSVPANVGSSDLIEAVLRGRSKYKGSAPTAYMSNAVMIDMLLSKDSLGRRYYNTIADLAAALNVRDIVETEVLEGVTRDGQEVLMVIVNPADYSVGSTRGGEISKFDQFDIDFNQYKYLIEGRLSGALTRHKTAQVVLRGSGTLATLTVPTFNSSTGVVTIPTVTGVTYKNQGTGATLSAGAQTALALGASLSVVAVPNSGYYFPHNSDADWTFTRPLA